MKVEATLTVARLERALTPSSDDAYACWSAKVLAADNAGTMWAEGESRLDIMGFNQCLIPPSLGGQCRGMDTLMDLFRALYRKDPCLGLGYAGSNFIACCNIWAIGSAPQQKMIAHALGNNEKLACSYYEPAHGNDLAAISFVATRQDGHWVLDGEKKLTSNISTCSHFVAFARTSVEPGSRSHTQILVSKSQLPAGALQDLPRHQSVGMRGVQLGGIRCQHVRLPYMPDEDLLMGEEGKALENAMRSFQVTRTLLPGMFIGILDSGLRLATRFSLQRYLYGHCLANFPSARQILSSAQLDLLMADCFSRLSARALHFHPAFCCLYAPAVKIVVPKLLIGAMNRLAEHLGASFYQTDGDYGLFQKLLRDVKPAGFAHIGRPACELTLLPLLFMLAKRTAGIAEPAELSPELAAQTSIDEPMDFSRLRVAPNGRDPLLDSLLYNALLLNRPLASRIIAARAKLLLDLQTLDPCCLSAAAPASLHRLSALYAGLIAVAACLACHRATPQRLPRWLTQLIVKRFMTHLQPNGDDLLSEEENDQVFEYLRDAYQREVSFDLMQYQLQGWGN